MNELSKRNAIWGLKVLLAFIAGFAALITTNEIFNVAGATDGFHKVVAIINVIVEVIAFVYFFKYKVKINE